MHVIRNRKTGEILHVDYSTTDGPLPAKEVYTDFDTTTMELGWTEKAYIPGYFSIDESGIIVQLSIAQAVEQGLYALEPKQKLVNGQIVEKSKSDLVSEGLVSIEEIKEELHDYFSSLSFEMRRQLIPDYKLENVAIGVYNKDISQSYRKTIEAFRQEFYRLKEQIEKAKTIEEVEAIKPRFPEVIISA